MKKSAFFNAAGGFWCVLIIFGGFAIIGYETVSGTPIVDAEEGLLQILQQSGNSLMFGLACVFILAACMGTYRDDKPEAVMFEEIWVVMEKYTE